MAQPIKCLLSSMRTLVQIPTTKTGPGGMSVTLSTGEGEIKKYFLTGQIAEVQVQSKTLSPKNGECQGKMPDVDL